MKEQIKMRITKRTLILALILLALFSIFVLSRIMASPVFYAPILESLNDKEASVMKLAAIAAASSTALSLIPGDAAMPIANQIAELTSYFIVILGAILLEKMLITVVGYVSFGFIIPAACLVEITHLCSNRVAFRNLAIKLAVFGIILFAAIPVSIQASNLIYDSYQTSIEKTINDAEQNNNDIEKTKKDIYKTDRNWFEKIGDYLSDLTSKIGTDISEIVNKGEDSFTKFLDAIAILIITSCVIPIVVILIFVWLIKIVFGFDSKRLSPRYRKGD